MQLLASDGDSLPILLFPFKGPKHAGMGSWASQWGCCFLETWRHAYAGRVVGFTVDGFKGEAVFKTWRRACRGAVGDPRRFQGAGDAISNTATPAERYVWDLGHRAVLHSRLAIGGDT